MRTLDNGSIEPVWARIRDRNGIDISALTTDIELAYGLEINEDAPVLGWAAPIDAEVLKPSLVRVACEVEAIRVGNDPTNYKLWARFGPGPTIKLLGKFRVQ
jgi:hypothetical protein